jgi:hypothetical protein
VSGEKTQPAYMIIGILARHPDERAVYADKGYDGAWYPAADDDGSLTILD